MSEWLIPYNQAAAILLLRIILGMLFFFQGYDKIVNLTLPRVIQTVSVKYRQKGFRQWMINLGVYVTSFIELIGGMLLILGLYRSITLYVLGVDLIIVVFGFSLVKPMWKNQHVLFRLVLLTTLLLLPAEWDWFALDTLIQELIY